MADELHIYQCWACKTTLSSTVKSAGTGHPYRCLNDQAPMSYLFSMPIESDTDRALAARGIVFNPAAALERAAAPNTKRPCDWCKRWVEGASMIRIGVAGKYCSASCADLGSERHRVRMEAQTARLETLYEKQPWLRPAVKETA